jgi:signal peptidase I
LKKFFSNTLVREIIIFVILAVPVIFISRAALQTYEVFQTSMEPNFVQGERVMVLKSAYWFGGPQRGDVIILRAPDNSGEEWIKRVIGLPGDTIRIDNGVVYVNGVKLDEPYVQRPFDYSMNELTVPPDNYFFLGDNRDVSNDSHRGWYITRESVIGKAWLVTWPPSDWGSVPSYPLNNQVALLSAN